MKRRTSSEKHTQKATTSSPPNPIGFKPEAWRNALQIALTVGILSSKTINKVVFMETGPAVRHRYMYYYDAACHF